MDEYKKHSPKQFYDWLSEGQTMEVRFLSNFKGEKFADWSLIKELSELYKLEYRFNSLYVDSWDSLKTILLHRENNWPMTRLYNIFIGVNPKRKAYVRSSQGLIYKSFYGGIAGTSHIMNILADIEHIGERSGNATEEMLEECIQGAEHLVKLLQTNNYYINISGNGVHLWMKLEEPIPLPIPEFNEGPKGLKYRLKEEPINTFIKTYNRYIEKLNKLLSDYNPKLKVDEGAKDIARIARPPGSWNVKKNKTPRAVGTIKIGSLTVNNDIPLININNKSFMAVRPIITGKSRSIQKTSIKTAFHRYNLSNIQQSPLYQLLVSQLLPSTASRNHYLEQSFARLLKDNNIKVEEVSHLVEEMDRVQEKNVQVDPDYLDGDEPFNSEQVNNYCFMCKVDLVYNLMEDVPNIKNYEQYDNLNYYSDKTIKSMALQGQVLPFHSLLDLKMTIRRLIDKGHSRSTVFFTLKDAYREDWDYLYRNKIIQQILNKTRKRMPD